LKALTGLTAKLIKGISKCTVAKTLYLLTFIALTSRAAANRIPLQAMFTILHTIYFFTDRFIRDTFTAFTTITVNKSACTFWTFTETTNLRAHVTFTDCASPGVMFIAIRTIQKSRKYAHHGRTLIAFAGLTTNSIQLVAMWTLNSALSSFTLITFTKWTVACLIHLIAMLT